MVEPTVSAVLASQPTIINTVEPTIETKNEIVLLDFAVAPDGKKLAVYLNTGVYLYDIETTKRTAFYEFESDEYYSALNAGTTIYPAFGAPGAVAFSPDGSEIAISGKFQDEYISIWDLQTHEIVDYVAYYPNGNFVRELEYSPSGNTLLIRSTYPKSRLQCPELGDPPEDTLTLVSLNPRNNLFEKRDCTRYATVEFSFSEGDTVYFFHYADSSLYQMDEVNTQTGNIIISEKLDTRLNGRIYDVSPNGKLFAAYDTSNPSDGMIRTILIDTTTREISLPLDGMIDFLDNEDRFLVYTSGISSQGPLQLQENDNRICTFDGIEYYRRYTQISRDNRTITSLTFDNKIFQDSIQIWDIPSCKLIKTIPFG
jgi:WD40 repeat protein